LSFALNRWGGHALVCLCAMACLCLLQGVGFAQATSADTTQPIEAPGGFLQSQGAQPKFQAASKLSTGAKLAVREGRIFSVPNFAGSFAWQGNNYPYTIVGGKPQAGGTTEIPVQLVPISLFFEEFADESGAHLILSPEQVVPRVLSSPNFHDASYATGVTQFADAVQRAQFNGIAGKDWHTLLGAPEVLKPLTIDVPRGLAKVYRNRSNGTTYAIVDTNFFISQLNTIIQLENLRPDALAIALTSNIFLAPQSDIKKCCVLAFHTSFDMGELTQMKFVQTFIWASWVDQGILGTSLADVTPISHEISEWMNNPFGSNVVPAWQVPNSTGCQNNLETGDPLALMPNAGYPVTIDGFTYHPQSQVMLQWFQRGATSDALEGAFSFPDQSLMTGPSQACPTR
jgi:chitinase